MKILIPHSMNVKRIRRKEMRRISRILIGFVLLIGVAGGVSSQQRSGKMGTWPPGSSGISASVLSDMIKKYIPAETDKLLVLAQCYGGSMAVVPKLNQLPQIAIVSGTSPGEVAYCGGYHDDAARALKPGPGRTGLTPHQEGAKGKHQLETPMTIGTLAPAKFSLVPTKPNSKIEGRVVIAYFGRPMTKYEWIKFGPQGHTIPAPASWAPKGPALTQRGYTKTTFTDDADAAQIRANFAGGIQTTVIIAGGKAGRPGYNHPGNVTGLLDAIKAAGKLIKGQQNQNDVSKWQFILFIGDHGELGLSIAINKTVPAGGGKTKVATKKKTLNKSQQLVDALRSDPDAQPGFTAFASFAGQNYALQRQPGGYQDVFAAGSVHLEVIPATPGGPILLTTLRQTIFDINDDAILGNEPGEGVELFFPVDKQVFIDRLLDTEVDLYLINNSGMPLVVTEMAQVTGGIARQVNTYRTKPPVRKFLVVLLVVLGVFLLWMLWRLRLRKP